MAVGGSIRVIHLYVYRITPAPDYVRFLIPLSFRTVSVRCQYRSKPPLKPPKVLGLSWHKPALRSITFLEIIPPTKVMVKCRTMIAAAS